MCKSKLSNYAGALATIFLTIASNSAMAQSSFYIADGMPIQIRPPFFLAPPRIEDLLDFNPDRITIPTTTQEAINQQRREIEHLNALEDAAIGYKEPATTFSEISLRAIDELSHPDDDKIVDALNFWTITAAVQLRLSALGAILDERDLQPASIGYLFFPQYSNDWTSFALPPELLQDVLASPNELNTNNIQNIEAPHVPYYLDPSTANSAPQ